MTHRAALTCALLSVGVVGCDGKNGGTGDASATGGGGAPMGSEGGSGQGGVAASDGASGATGGPTPLGCEAVLGEAVDVTKLPSCEALAFEGSGASAGALELRGHLTDAEGLPIVGARVGLSGDASAVRYSDLTGGYGFRVDAGAYMLDVSAECGFETSSVELGSLDRDTRQDFVAVDAGCLVARLVNATASGVLFSLLQDGVQLASSSAVTQERGSVDGALARLQQIAEERPIFVCELSIDGGPAIERRAVVVSQGPLDSEDDVSQVNLTTAVAVETQVVRFESILPPAATCDTVERVLAAARAFTAAQLPELRKQTP